MNKKKMLVCGLTLLVAGGAVTACSVQEKMPAAVIEADVDLTDVNDVLMEVVSESIPLPSPPVEEVESEGVESEEVETTVVDETEAPSEAATESSEPTEEPEPSKNDNKNDNTQNQNGDNDSSNNNNNNNNNNNSGNNGSNNSSPTGSVAGAAYVGMFSIPGVGVSVPCYASSSQAVCDAQNAAAYFYMSNHLVIADHVNQGFNRIKSCSPGMVAYAPDGTKYECITIMQGINTGYSLTLTDGTNIREIYPGALVAYTCNSNWQSVTMVFFKVYGTNIDEPSEEFEGENDFYPGENSDKVPCSPGTHEWDLIDSFEYWDFEDGIRKKMLREVFICSVCESEWYKATEIVQPPEEEPPVEEPTESETEPTQPSEPEETKPEETQPEEPPKETEPEIPPTIPTEPETPDEPSIPTEPPIVEPPVETTPPTEETVPPEPPEETTPVIETEPVPEPSDSVTEPNLENIE